MEGASENEAKILELAQNSSTGITDKEIQVALPNLDPEEKKTIINKFLRTKTFILFKKPNGQTLFKLSNTRNLAKTKDVKGEESIVLETIGAEGNMGIWIRNLKFKTKLTAPVIEKILKELEKKGLVKLVKSSQKKKIYMLAHLEPDKSLTGNSWCTGENFDDAAVDILTEQCYQFLDGTRKNSMACVNMPIHQRTVLSFATSQECCEFINESKLCKFIVEVDEVEMILEALIYDCKVEKILNANGIKSYRAVTPLMDSPSLMKTPCGVCQIRKSCQDRGDVTPKKCTYLDEWAN